MNIRGRVMKLERVTQQVERRPGTREDAVLWTRRFRAADPDHERVYQDILAYGRANRAGYIYAERRDEIHATECFKAIYFPIRHAVDKDWEPHCGGFAQTPDMLKRLVNGVCRYQNEHLDVFPLEVHYLDALAGAKGDGIRDLWCFYADLADLWVVDRQHPTVAGWRNYLADRGLDR